MFSRPIAACKAGLRALNPGDPINQDLVAWIPFGHIENAGDKGFNLLGSPKITARNLDTWGNGSFYGAPTGAKNQGGIFGGRTQSSDDYVIRPSLYYTELPRLKPTRNITVAVRLPGQNLQPIDVFGTYAVFGNYAYGSPNIRVEIRTTTTGIYGFANADTLHRGAQHIIMSYDGATVRMLVNSTYGETASTQSGDLDWNTNTSWYFPSKSGEDFRIWSRALGHSEMRRWFVEGPNCGALAAPSRRFAVVGTVAAAANINQRLPLLGVGD